MSANGYTLQPIALLRWFGVHSTKLTNVDGKLVVKSDRQQAVVINKQRLLNALVIKRSFFASSLCIPVGNGAYEVAWLDKANAEAGAKWLNGVGYAYVSPQITLAAKQLEEILATGYLRSSHIAAMRAIAQAASRLFKVMPNTLLVSETQLRHFAMVNKIVHWGTGHIEAHRDRYIERMAIQYSDYFNSVETNPLTSRQRKACIIDEDNNLVLAGAGTGKTSVMIGRAGFLLASGQAKTEEVLLLAFGNKAAAEMQERLVDRLEAAQHVITASTFHKLGKDIIAMVEGAQPSISAIASDDKKLLYQVNQWFEEHVKDVDYRARLLRYFEKYLYPAVNPFDYKEEGDYYESLTNNEIRTLKGEAVKSIGECLIANQLFKLGVAYEYEASYKFATRSLDFRQYAPDFYLPDYDIYVEFYGIDRQGGTAPYVDQQRYSEGIKWKRDLHKKHGTQLFELYHYEKMEGVLLERLETLLAAAEITTDPLPAAAVLDTLREFGAITKFSELLSDLLKRYKSSCFNKERLEQKIKLSPEPGNLIAALELLKPILADYETYLVNEKAIDFDDMIGKALRYVKAGRFRSSWRFILVDEFQDISDPRAQLLKALKDSNTDCSLFCVGDDWQAIYRFTGSDIAFTNKFEDYFGVTKITTLDKTFRFNNSISEIASRFIQENPAQLKKQLVSLKQVKRPAVVLYRAQASSGGGIDQRLIATLTHISKRVEQGRRCTVLLLARFRFILPDAASQLKELRRLNPKLDIQVDSVHAAKGKEADYVIILGLSSGRHGFPSRKVSHPLLEALLPKAETYAFAEERRLFYVAMTRAKARVYLITDMSEASAFVVELINNKYPLELDEFEVSLTQQLFQHIRCVRCTSGSMVFRSNVNSRFQRFMGCTNYPLCKNTDEVCQHCGQAMEHIGRFRVCIAPGCRAWVPKCVKCDGDMAFRPAKPGKYSAFWSCKNWRSEGISCQSTENKIAYDGPMPV